MRKHIIAALLLVAASGANAGWAGAAAAGAGYVDGMNGNTSREPAKEAYWTGQMRLVQLVGGGEGVNCEYNYAGQTFWRAFRSSCAPRVAVN